jgi:hypothetical protein
MKLIVMDPYKLLDAMDSNEENSRVVNRDGRHFLKYDSIRYQLLDGMIEYIFLSFRGEDLAYFRPMASIQDAGSFNITGLRGEIEINPKEMINVAPPPKAPSA